MDLSINCTIFVRLSWQIKKISPMIKKYPLVLVAIFCFVLSGFGQYSGTGTFTKITSLTDLTDGYYVVAEDEEGFAMNNSHNGTFLDRTVISPLGTTITDPSVTIVWKIETNSSGRSIFNEDISKYVSYTGFSNNVQIVDNVTTNNQRWDVTYSGGSFIFTNVAVSTRILQYNPSSPRFACYASNQRKFVLFKLDTPTGPNITATPTNLAGLDYILGAGPSVQQSFDIEGTLLVAGTTVTSSSINFEVSLTSGSGYGNSVSVPAGTLNGTTTIYTRLVAGLAVNTYSSTITISNSTPGLGTTPTINVSGEVLPPPPANDLCSGAISLSPTSTCTYITYTNVNATDSGEGNPGCANYNGEDVWFSVVVPATGEITIDTNNIDFTDSGMALYSGTCGSLSLIECDDDGSLNANMSSIYFNNISLAGTTLYIRVWEYNGGTTGDFGICITTPTPCVAPTGQPTNLILSNITGSSIDGSFNATTADEYLVVVSTSATLGANPINGTTYSAGDTIGLGTVVQSSNVSMFTATGLSQTTQYYFFVFALNDASCSGGPAYNTINPLTGNSTTITGPCLEEDFTGWNHSYSNWTETTSDGTWNSNGCYAGSNRVQLNDVGDWLELPPISNAQTFEYETAVSSSSSGTQDGMILQYFDGSIWVDVQQDYFTSTVYSTVIVNLPFAVSNGTNIRLRLYRSDDFRVQFINSIKIYCGTPCTPPADPSGVISSIDAPDFCETAELAFSGSPPSNIIYYWQTDASGIDMTDDAANALDVTISGDFYVRAYNTVTSCWSTGVIGPYTVTISNLPDVTDQPDNINVANGANAIFSATVTGAISYQWQVSIDGGTNWTNTGTNSNTLTVLSASISMHGYLYRIVATNSCGDTVSDEAVLFVHSGSPCIEEDFNSFPDTGWTNSGTINETSGAHSGASQPCRVFGINDAIITSQADYPTILEFYQDASVAASGSFATVDYRIGTGAWTLLHSFSVTEAGKTELVDLTDVSGVNLASFANVRFRFNSTFNSWYLDDVKVYCTPCTPPTTTTSIDLSSGPIGTYVTISGSQLGTATISFNSTTLTPISQNTNEIVIQIPNNAIDGSIIIKTNSIVCDSAFPFNVIDQELSCQTNITPPPTDLFIYELFDEDQNIDGSGGAWGNGGMITVFNGTLEIKDLSEYRLYRSTDYSNTGSFPYSLWHSLSGTLAPGEIYRIWINGSNCSDYATPYETEFIGFNANDGVELRKDNGSGSYITIDQLHTENIVGYHYLRDLSVAKPVATYNSADWSFTDIYPSSPYCVGAGQAPNFEGGTPTILLDTPTTTCNTFEITADATEGYTGIFSADSYDLTFQWYYYDGINDMWNPISTGGDYVVVNSASQSTLTINNIFTKTNYQFYCDVSEGSSCSTASEAIKIELNRTTWNGTVWTPTTPDIDTIAIINDDYDTGDGTNGQTSFDACSLIINPDNTLIVRSDDYVNVNFDVTNNGTFMIENNGSLVQIDDSGVNTGNINMERKASVDNLDYVYWSSPVSNFDVNNISTTQYIYNWNPTFNNTNGTQGNWIPASGNMDSGVGYIVRGFGSQAAPVNPGDLNFTVDFLGVPFNGLTTVTVSRGIDKDNIDDNWNLIGNPYPSAVDVFLFLDHTPNKNALDGFVHFWTHGNDPIYTQDPFYYDFGSNYTATDYIAYNAVGAGNGPGNISIAAGQSFMVNMLNGTNSTDDSASTNIEFNNSMRNKAFDNSQFYRTTEPSYNAAERHRIWLDLVSETQGTNRILVGYVDGATMERDRMYDAITSVSSNQYLYSLIDETPFIIQGRSLPFNDTDAIPLGVNIVEQGNYHFAIAFIDGLFETDNQIIYLKDNELGFIHNLNEVPYSFTSDVGEFNNRFEIVFRDSFLSINEEEISANSVTIIEHQNGEVQFKVPNQYEIKKIEIIDLLGRTIYNLKGNSNSETYNLSNLSQATYIAKITLTNGQVISKKAVKRK